MNLDNLRDVYHEQLKDMYSAEKQLVEALPKMVEAAAQRELKMAISNHLEQTKMHMERVHQLLQGANVNPGRKMCKAMEGLIEEGSEMAKNDGDNDARDVGIIAAAQKVEHYEIATYGSLRAWARLLGEHDAANVLNEILDEEYDADNLLDKLAEGYMNRQAM
jgi:ferritin-like metal-binding protein YciE